MKILLLHPNPDARHGMTQVLQREGVALLLPASFEEAWQMLGLHGKSVEIAILHLEMRPAGSTLKWIEKLKSDPVHSDLPILLTTDQWSDVDCAKHQAGPFGVNAYLRSPWNDRSLTQVVQSVLGHSIGINAHLLRSSASIVHEVTQVHVPSQASPALPVLEDVSLVSPKNEHEISIILDSPDLESFTSPSLIVTKDIKHSPSPVPPPPEPIDERTVITSALDIAPEVASAETLDDLQQSIEIEPALEIPGKMAAEKPQEIPHKIAEEKPEEMLFEREASSLVGRAGLLFAEPLGDAVVPGGAAHSPDMETMKKFLLLREQDVAVLSHKLKSSQAQVSQLEKELAEEKLKIAEVLIRANEQEQKVQNYEKEKQALLDRAATDLQESYFQIKMKADQARLFETQMREATDQMERLKERVRLDIRKIRVREKELENRLEITKKDSEVLLLSREQKIVELKRKLDLIEFNMDLLQEQFSREKENSGKLRERLSRAAHASKIAMGLLDSPQSLAEPKESEGEKH